MSKIQLRGNCPCCGREQAVLASGVMSKHGYTVDHGWFNGVCPGQNHKPLQQERTVTDKIIAEVTEEVEQLWQQANDLRTGKIHPKAVKTGWGKHTDSITWEEATDYQQKDAVKSEAYRCESRARAGESFAASMRVLADEVHGKPLKEVKKAEAPAPICKGERRILNEKARTVVRIDGPRVYWTDDRGYNGWTGTQAWRKLPPAS